MRWPLIGFLLTAGIGTLIALRKAKRLGDFDPTNASEDPNAPPPDEPEWEGDCLLLGRQHHRFSPGPYRVCLTANQEKRLFQGKRKKQKKLGCGVFACAYTAPGSTKVVKFTRDSEDVAALLKAQKTGVVPKVFAVYRLKQGGRTIPKRDPITFREPPPAQDVAVYALVVERLRTIPIEDQHIINETLPDIAAVARGAMTGNDYCDSRVDENGIVGCDDIELGVVRAVEKLRAAGIVWGDLHAGNIGYDKRGKLKVLDLGFTQTELKRRIKILAGLGRSSRVPNFRLI
jgi:hypothetical protein